jgi:hypothetical protein
VERRTTISRTVDEKEGRRHPKHSKEDHTNQFNEKDKTSIVITTQVPMR